MKSLLLFIVSILSLGAIGQIGGKTAFPFLEMTYNARQAGLGDDFISVVDKDINLGVANPSLLNPKMQNAISFNQSLLSGGINFGMANYGFKLKELGTMSTYIKYVSSGKSKSQRSSVCHVFVNKVFTSNCLVGC